jgi:hypothetical protein
MKPLGLVLIGGLSILLAAFPSSAHHRLESEFNEAKIVKFKGIVILVARMNPHSLIFVDAGNDKGETERWAMETVNATQLDQFGLGRKGSLKIGDTIEVCGFATKYGVDPMKTYQAPEPISLSLKSIPRPPLTGRLMWPRTLTLTDGRKVEFGPLRGRGRFCRTTSTCGLPSRSSSYSLPGPGRAPEMRTSYLASNYSR